MSATKEEEAELAVLTKPVGFQAGLSQHAFPECDTPEPSEFLVLIKIFVSGFDDLALTEEMLIKRHVMDLFKDFIYTPYSL